MDNTNNKAAGSEAIKQIFNIVTNALKNKLSPSDVVDNLESDSVEAPLSAKQGKELKSLIENNTITFTEITAEEVDAIWNEVISSDTGNNDENVDTENAEDIEGS